MTKTTIPSIYSYNLGFLLRKKGSIIAEKKEAVDKQTTATETLETLIDSKKNMEVSWETLTKKYNVKIPFINYLRYIGFPFLKILKKLKVSAKLYKKFENEYKINSLKNLNFIKIHKGVLKTFHFRIFGHHRDQLFQSNIATCVGLSVFLSVCLSLFVSLTEHGA